jgi:pSer/pThr/pTyr-binding forkhead associated (FHA) protein
METTMWRWLIERESQQFSRAFIYVGFVFASLVVAAVLFGLLHSTGVLKLVWRDAGTEAQFAGAFAGFLVLLMFLIRSYDRAVSDRTRQLRGNVYLPGGRPAADALVWVEGIEGKRRANETGWFAIEVEDRAEYRVVAELDQRVAEVVCRRADIRNPLRIELGEPILQAGFSPFSLQVKGPRGEVQRQPLRTGDRVTIGRYPSSTILLPAYDKSASRHHAHVDVLEDRLRIKDGSINGAPSRHGTVLNGVKVTVADVFPGGVIKCGGTEVTVVSNSRESDVTDLLEETEASNSRIVEKSSPTSTV